MLRQPRSAYGPFAAFAAFGAFWGAWAVLVPLVQDELDASKAELGLALLGIGLGSLPAMILAGSAVNRRGPALLPLLLGALAVAVVAPALAGTLASLTLALVVVGACSGALDVSINAAAADVEARTGARIMQLAHALFSTGLVVGAVGAGIARELGAGRLEILLAAAATLACAAAANRGAPARSHEPARRRSLFHRHAVAFGLACGAAFFVESGIESWSALYLEREHDASPTAAALGPGVYAAAMVIGRLFGQYAAGRIRDRVLLGSGAVLSAVGLALASASPAIPLAVAGFFLGGAGVSVAAGIAFGAAGRSAGPAERGSAVATVTTIGYVSFLAGPPVMGATGQIVGLRASFALLAVVSIALGAVSLRLRLEDGQPSAARASSS